uniref:Uncharacterized protein n=1 Tax=Cacopsylla melanoneura TaxID=428564 RepID=A0A8D8U573_9HEMI
MSLKINFDKTNYMTFAIDSRGLPTTSTLQLPLDQNNIITLQRLTKTRYLGILIDQHLKWTDHIHQLKSKLRHLMYVFSNLKRVCSKALLREIYFAMVQSLTQYCIVAWGGAYSNIMTPLNRTLNILLRIILDKDRYFQSDELYRILDVPTIQDIYIFKVCIFSIKKQDMWTPGQTNYNTRQRGQMTTKTTHRSLTQRHFSYIGSKVFNCIPEDIWQPVEMASLACIRNRIREWLKNATNKEKIVKIVNQGISN